MTSGSRGESGGARRRPLLEPTFVSELERLSELPKRGSAGGSPLSGRRRSASEPRRVTRRGRSGAEDTPKGANDADSGAADLAPLFRRLFKARRSDLYLFIDSTESMEMPSDATGARKWDQACRLAAALGVAARARYKRIHVVTLGQGGGRRAPILHSTTGGETNQLSQALFATLQRQRPGGSGKFLTALDHYVRRAPEASVCLVISDFMTSEWEQGVNLLLDSPLRIALIQVLDPGDLDGSSLRGLNFHAGENAESGESAREDHALAIDPQILAGLHETLTGFCDSLAERCAEAGVGYYRTHTDAPFEKALIEALRG